MNQHLYNNNLLPFLCVLTALCVQLNEEDLTLASHLSFLGIYYLLLYKGSFDLFLGFSVHRLNEAWKCASANEMLIVVLLLCRESNQ